MNKRKKGLIIALSAAAGLIIIFAAYINDYYHALPEAAAIAATMDDEDGNLFLNGTEDIGIIIYPGGKVDEQAYAPLAKELNNAGYPVVVVKMPLRLAIFSPNKATEVMEAHPGIDRWVLAGHSLGGTAASMFVADHPDKIAGIVFMGSYPYKDLSALDLFALDITGSNDMVLNRQKAFESTPLYPADRDSLVIEGGNHAYFGSYGEQDGDGEASITNADQIAITAAYITESLDARP